MSKNKFCSGNNVRDSHHMTRLQGEDKEWLITRVQDQGFKLRRIKNNLSVNKWFKVQTSNMKRNDSCPYLPDNSISSVYVTPETKAKSKSLDRKSHHGIKPTNQSAIKSLFMNLKYQESDAKSDTSDARMSSKVYYFWYVWKYLNSK